MSASLRNRRLFMGAGLLVAVLVGLWILFGSDRYVSTEDAYVKMDMVSLSSRVGGPLALVPVKRNQQVQAGDLLAQVDPKPYEIAVAQAKADLEKERNDLLSDQAEFAQVQAQLAQAERDVSFYQRELDRNLKLKQVSVSEATLDQSRHDLDQAKANRDALQAQLKSVQTLSGQRALKGTARFTTGGSSPLAIHSYLLAIYQDGPGNARTAEICSSLQTRGPNDAGHASAST